MSTADLLGMELDAMPEASSATAEDWQKALARVVKGVVVLRTTACRAFDTETASSGYATGFIVDKERNLILTNRHVVKPGPVVAEAIFLNREEIPVYPLYRDPVHDFGFFRFDRGAVQFLEYEEIPLAPEAASVGLEIRVVGNDSGEKLSILAGTLARVDRDAPPYKKDGYNDFNTFYMQAASGTKGGSSGSPVIDCKGRAVAINAGSKVAGASAYFLPLDRVVRALQLLQNAYDESAIVWKPVDIPRGTLQMTLLHKGFDETRRLGLKRETEEVVRKVSPDGETGMLVVDSVVPDGPSHSKGLQPGDVLVRVNGEVVTQFLRLEILLDENVNNSLNLELERGGVDIKVSLKVQDLHSITPDHFLELSGAIIHPLSYQQARNFRFPCGLVYVAEPGYMLTRAGVPKYAIVKRVGGEDVSTLDDLINVFRKLSRGARVPLEFLTYNDRHRSKSVLVTVDRHEWYAPPQIYTLNNCTGLWESRLAISDYPPSSLPAKHIEQHLPLSKVEVSLEGETASAPNGEEMVVASAEAGLQNDEGGNQSTDASLHQGETVTYLLGGIELEPGDVGNSELVEDVVPATTSGVDHVLEPALVMMEVHVPPSGLLDGVHAQHFFGTGVVVYHTADLGLVAVDRNTVAISVADVMISFAAYPAEIPAEVVFLHPVHNFALVAYDPRELGDAGAAAVTAAVLHPEQRLRRGDVVHLVGLSRSLQATSRKSVVTNPAATLSVGSADCPRYRAMNMEVIELDNDFGAGFSGVLADDSGRVQALWASFSTQVKYGDNSSSEDHQFVRGIPISYISEIVQELLNRQKGPALQISGVKRCVPTIRILEAELYPTLLSKARSFGLSDRWVQALKKKDPLRRQVLRVKGCLAGSQAEKVLEHGDMLLAVHSDDGSAPITCFQDIEAACERADSRDGNLRMTVFRQGLEMELTVGTDVRDGLGTTRMIAWAGCVIQEPHAAVRALGFLPAEGHGVYVARWCHGSPAHRYGLYALQWIVEVNGKPTTDLESFVNIAKELDHGSFARVKVVHLNGKPRVLTLKQDLHYWPMWELRFDPVSARWRRTTLKGR